LIALHGQDRKQHDRTVSDQKRGDDLEGDEPGHCCEIETGTGEMQE
jgi:hypothetical protein